VTRKREFPLLLAAAAAAAVTAADAAVYGHFLIKS